MTRQVASAVLKGRMNADIKCDLTTEEEDRLEGLSEVSSASIQRVTATPLDVSERDFNILKGILTTTKPYSQLAKEAGVATSYISLLIEGEQGKSAWDMLNQQEADFIRKISKSPSFRERVLKMYGELTLN